MQDLEQVSYWQEKRLMGSHWYNIYNPAISVKLRLTVLCETKRDETVLCETVLCEMVLCENASSHLISST